MEELKEYLKEHLKFGVKYMVSENNVLLFLNGCCLDWKFLEKINSFIPIQVLQVNKDMVNICFDGQGTLPIEDKYNIKVHYKDKENHSFSVSNFYDNKSDN